MALKGPFEATSSRMTIFERAEISCDRERYRFGRQRAQWGRLHDDSLKDESKSTKRAGLA
jgi:hypothetical protein